MMMSMLEKQRGQSQHHHSFGLVKDISKLWLKVSLSWQNMEISFDRLEILRRQGSARSRTRAGLGTADGKSCQDGDPSRPTNPRAVRVSYNS